MIVCGKPAGLVSEGGSGGGAPDLLAKELAARGGNPALYPVDRLDRETEGAPWDLFSVEDAAP